MGPLQGCGGHSPADVWQNAGWPRSKAPGAAARMGLNLGPRAEPGLAPQPQRCALKSGGSQRPGKPQLDMGFEPRMALACYTALHPLLGCLTAGRPGACVPPRPAPQLPVRPSSCVFSSCGHRPTSDSSPEVPAMLTRPSAPGPCCIWLGPCFRKS